MERIAQFERVTVEQFTADVLECLPDMNGDCAAEAYEDVVLPKRATKGSAGYDIISPISFTLLPGQTLRMPTGLRVAMDEGYVLFVLPKSGLGFKFRLQLDNTVGVVDQDYYGAENQGHILIQFTNDSRSDSVLDVKAGKAVAQAVFLPFGITKDDEADGKRVGGFGSTEV